MADHEIAVQLTVVPAPIEIAGLLLKAIAYSRQAIGLETRELGGKPGEVEIHQPLFLGLVPGSVMHVSERITRCVTFGGKR